MYRLKHPQGYLSMPLKEWVLIVNDIRGASDDEVIRVAVDYGAKLSIMHMQGEPKNMQDNPNMIMLYWIYQIFLRRG